MYVCACIRLCVILKTIKVILLEKEMVLHFRQTYFKRQKNIILLQLYNNNVDNIL